MDKYRITQNFLRNNPVIKEIITEVKVLKWFRWITIFSVGEYYSESGREICKMFIEQIKSGERNSRGKFIEKILDEIEI